MASASARRTDDQRDRNPVEYEMSDQLLAQQAGRRAMIEAGRQQRDLGEDVDDHAEHGAGHERPGDELGLRPGEVDVAQRPADRQDEDEPDADRRRGGVGVGRGPEHRRRHEGEEDGRGAPPSHCSAKRKRTIKSPAPAPATIPAARRPRSVRVPSTADAFATAGAVSLRWSAAPRGRRFGKHLRCEGELARFERVADSLDQVAHRRFRDPVTDHRVEDHAGRPERRTVRALERQPRRLDRSDPQPERPVEVREQPGPGAPFDHHRVVAAPGLGVVGVHREHQLDPARAPARAASARSRAAGPGPRPRARRPARNSSA